MSISEWSKEVRTTDMKEKGGEEKGDKHGRKDARSRRGARSAGRLPIRGGVRLRGQDRHARLCACRPSCFGMGRKGRHGHQFGAADQSQEYGLSQPRRSKARLVDHQRGGKARSEEHTSELKSLMRLSNAVFCFHKIYITKNQK